MSYTKHGYLSAIQTLFVTVWESASFAIGGYIVVLIPVIWTHFGFISLIIFVFFLDYVPVTQDSHGFNLISFFYRSYIMWQLGNHMTC